MQQEEDNISFAFPKKERISSNIAIEQLVKQQRSVTAYPIKCYYNILSSSSEMDFHRMAVAVPKRLFKSAVDRNRIKRLIREAYRLNKSDTLLPLSKTQRRADMFFLFIGKVEPSFAVVTESIIEIFKKITVQQ